MVLRFKKQEQLDIPTTLHRIKNGDEKLLSTLYETYRKDFLKFGYRYLKDETKILDVYQDAFIAFYENVKADKIIELKSTLKTYIFSIGKYMLIRKFKTEIKTITKEDISTFDFVDNSFEEKEELSELQETLRLALGQLGEKCRQLLVLFYYRKYGMDAIVENMGYKNTDVAKNQKRRCMKYLKDIIKKQNDE